MDNLTIIYYSSNREDPKFEKKVQQTLMEAIGGLPIISVSQKPIDFGQNICVGNLGATPENMLYQLKVGAMAATTPFISTAEADCLYHKSYYDFKPERDDTIYRTECLYVLWLEKSKHFHFKRRKEMGGITGREYFIKVIDRCLSKPFDHLSNVVKKCSRSGLFYPEVPMVSLKTRNGMHYGTTYNRKNNKLKLPYWGTARDLARLYR